MDQGAGRRTVGILMSAVCVVMVLAMPTLSLAREGMESAGVSLGGNVGMFLPNSDSNGMQGFNTGITLAVDARFNIIKYFAVGLETGYYQASGSQSGGPPPSINISMTGSAIPLIVNLLATIPAGIVTPFFGVGGGIYMTSFSASAGGQSVSASNTATGIQIPLGIGITAGPGQILVEGKDTIVTTKFTFNNVTSPDLNWGGFSGVVGYLYQF